MRRSAFISPRCSSGECDGGHDAIDRLASRPARRLEWRAPGVLSIEPTRRVRYGERELCAAGTVREIRIGPSRLGEVGDVAVWLKLTDGDVVSIPSSYFPGFKSRARARTFAALLARLLGVPVT